MKNHLGVVVNSFFLFLSTGRETSLVRFPLKYYSFFDCAPLKYYGFFGNIMDFSVRFPFKYYGFVGNIMDFSVRFPFK